MILLYYDYYFPIFIYIPKYLRSSLFAEILTLKDVRLLIYLNSRVKIVRPTIKLINISQFQLERNATIVGVPTVEKNMPS